MTTPDDILNLLDDLLSMTKKQGADASDAVYIDSNSLTVAQRLGNPEKLDLLLITLRRRACKGHQLDRRHARQRK